MKEIVKSPELVAYLSRVLGAYDVTEEFIQKAFDLKEVPPLPGEESMASSYEEADVEWHDSASESNEEAAALRKLIEFAPERVKSSEGSETMEEVLVDLFDSASMGDDEDGSMLVIRALAELFLSGGATTEEEEEK